MNRSEIASCTRARIRISLRRFFLLSHVFFLFQSPSLSSVATSFRMQLLLAGWFLTFFTRPAYATIGCCLLLLSRTDCDVSFPSTESSFSHSLLFGIESHLGQTVRWILLRTESRLLRLDRVCVIMMVKLIAYFKFLHELL